MSRISSLLETLVLVTGRLAHAPQQIDTALVKRVVIIQNAKLGDMVCTTPLFRAVRTHRPDVRICVVGNVVNKELLAGHPDVDRYIVFNTRDLATTLQEIRAFGADYACVCTPDADAIKVLMHARVPTIIVPKVVNGYCPWQTLTYRILREAVTSVPHRMCTYAPREYLRLLEPLGIHESRTDKALTFTPEAKERARELLARADERMRIGIAPTAGNKIKEWPAERFAAVADNCIKKHNATVFVVGSPNDVDLAVDMQRQMGHAERVVDTTGKLSLDELKAFIAGLDLFVSVDTGPIYVAEAFGVPTVDIVGPMDEQEQPPMGVKHKVVIAERQEPQLHIMNARLYDAVEARRQVEDISVDMVTSAITELL